MSTAGANGSALDATVVTSPDQAANKARAAVVYYHRELDILDEGIERLKDKAEKFKGHAQAAAADLKAARQARGDLAALLAEAERHAEEVAG